MVIPDSEICCSVGGPVTVDKIEIGEVSIPRVDLRDFNGNFSYGSSKAKSVEIEMKLSIQSSFSGKVILPWPLPDKNVSGSVNFSAFTEKHSLGDIVMAGGSFSMQTPQASFGPFSMKIDPIGNKADKTSVKEVNANRIEMRHTVVPLDNPLGFNLGSSFPVQNPMEPVDLSIRETCIATLESKGISTPRATARDIKALNIRIPSVTTAALEIKSNTNMNVTTSKKLHGSGVTRTGDAKDAEITSTVTLKIQSVTLRIKGGVEFTDLRGTVTTSQADSEKFAMQLKLNNIRIIGLSICGMSIPEMVMEV